MVGSGRAGAVVDAMIPGLGWAAGAAGVAANVVDSVVVGRDSQAVAATSATETTLASLILSARNECVLIIVPPCRSHVDGVDTVGYFLRPTPSRQASLSEQFVRAVCQSSLSEQFVRAVCQSRAAGAQQPTEREARDEWRIGA